MEYNFPTSLSTKCFQIQERARSEFNWPLNLDIQSAQKLAHTFLDIFTLAELNATWELIGQKLSKASTITIIGADSSVEKWMDVLPDWLKPHNHRATILVADGSIGALLALEEPYQSRALKRTCAILSDGDGFSFFHPILKDFEIALILHAHGNNDLSPSLSDAKAVFGSKICFSHQVPNKITGGKNIGGLTDGDRCACLAVLSGKSKSNIIFEGFHLTRVGKWSGKTDPRIKIKKLDYMGKVLKILGFSEEII